MPVLRRLIKVSAVVLGAGLVVTGCSSSPVKMGAAAIVGNERITIATLNTEVTKLNQAAKQYPGVVQLSPVQATQETLGWLIRFQIFDQLASQAGITVSTSQERAALEQILASAEGLRAAAGHFERHPRPDPGRQRDPAEPVRRGRPVPGHRDPVRRAGQRRQDTHVEYGAGDHYYQTRACSVRGGQDR